MRPLRSQRLVCRDPALELIWTVIDPASIRGSDRLELLRVLRRSIHPRPHDVDGEPELATTATPPLLGLRGELPSPSREAQVELTVLLPLGRNEKLSPPPLGGLGFEVGPRAFFRALVTASMFGRRLGSPLLSVSAKTGFSPPADQMYRCACCMGDSPHIADQVLQIQGHGRRKTGPEPVQNASHNLRTP
jgi:hypothetical protein